MIPDRWLDQLPFRCKRLLGHAVEAVLGKAWETQLRDSRRQFLAPLVRNRLQVDLARLQAEARLNCHGAHRIVTQFVWRIVKQWLSCSSWRRLYVWSRCGLHLGNLGLDLGVDIL